MHQSAAGNAPCPTPRLQRWFCLSGDIAYKWDRYHLILIIIPCSSAAVGCAATFDYICFNRVCSFVNARAHLQYKSTFLIICSTAFSLQFKKTFVHEFLNKPCSLMPINTTNDSCLFIRDPPIGLDVILQ